MRFRPARGILRVLVGAIVLSACSGGAGNGSPEAERGRQTYLAQCTACHASDPAQAGPVGPSVKAASRELLEAKVLQGAYPPGYSPKRNSTVMQPMPNLASSIPDLAAYLR